MSNTYEENKKLNLEDKLSSKWLKNAIKALDKRNAREAKNDAEELCELMEQRSDEEIFEWDKKRRDEEIFEWDRFQKAVADKRQKEIQAIKPSTSLNKWKS